VAPRRPAADPPNEDEDVSGWGAPDEAEVQHGASWDDLTEEDQRLITMAAQAPAFDPKAPTTLPQPSRAQSVNGLPKVKSGIFPRLLK
jgi:hypothetical protein